MFYTGGIRRGPNVQWEVVFTGCSIYEFVISFRLHDILVYHTPICDESNCYWVVKAHDEEIGSQPYINITEAWSECEDMRGHLAHFAKYDDFAHFIRGMDRIKNNQSVTSLTREGNPNYCPVCVCPVFFWFIEFAYSVGHIKIEEFIFLIFINIT